MSNGQAPAGGKAISYLRVSTDRQGRSGLGLEAQREGIASFLARWNWRLLREYIEVESGKTNERPELWKAINDCKRTGAKLVIAKLDRLSRNLAFIVNLRDSGVSFVAADMPDANELTIHVLAAVAQHERRMISQRTKEALQAAKVRGVRLGKPENLTKAAARKGRLLGQHAAQKKSQEFARRLAPEVRKLQAEGLSLRAIARRFDAEGVLGPRGRAETWTPQAVKNLLRVAKEVQEPRSVQDK